MIEIKWNNVKTFFELKGKLPEEARPVVKQYCDVMQAIFRRDDWLEGKTIELEIKNEFDTMPVDLLIEISEKTFKELIMKYGYKGNQ